MLVISFGIQFYNMKTIILGSGYLSNNLKKKLFNSEIISASDISKINSLNLKKKKFNLIINSFYKSSELANISSYEFFLKKSLLQISVFLDSINPRLINKIIYTSSAAVYNSINDNIDKIDTSNRKLYSSTKINAENLLNNFSNKNNISFSIFRVFNIYGPKENFSIISKIINSVKKNKILKILNKGQSIRDFIYINDVVKIYQILLKQTKNDIYDIGTGIGIKILDIINSLPKIQTTKIENHANEIEISIANIANFKKIKPEFKFNHLQSYLKRQLKKNFINKIYDNISINKNYLSKNISGSIIYGCGYAGVKLAKSLLNFDPNSVYCFVDDHQSKIGTIRFAKNVISFEDLLVLSKNNIISNIIIAIPSLSESKLSILYKKLFPLCTSISVLPNKEELRNKDISLEDISEIDVGSLINRRTFVLNNNILKQFSNKNVLVTGGGGSIGSELCRQILQGKPSKLIILEHSEFALYKIIKNLNNSSVVPILGDINNSFLLKKLVAKYQFNYVYHAAAYKHVSLLEQNVLSAIKNNILGTKTLFKSLENIKTNLSIISTDKAVQPKSILGYSKRFSEIFCQVFSKDKHYRKLKLSIIRFGNVFGSDGSVIQLFIEQLKNKKSITITDKRAERYFMSIKEACNLVLQSSHLKKYPNSVFVLNMGKPIKILDMLKRIIKFFNYDYSKTNIIETGLVNGEKLKERLSYKNLIKINNNIMLAKDPIYKKDKILKCLSVLEELTVTSDTKNARKILKSFFR
jgi:FlaA1/EpsC-like NDP-sugar epimerase